MLYCDQGVATPRDSAKLLERDDILKLFCTESRLSSVQISDSMSSGARLRDVYAG